MTYGDAAALAGMDVVPGTASVRDSFGEHNKTRDYIAERTNAVTPIAKGGTGATTDAAARTALSVYSIATIDAALAGKAPTSHGHNYPQIGPGAIDNGGFGCNVGVMNAAAASVSGSIFNPGALSPVASAWTALAAQSSDGRIGIQASARRFKKNIKTLTYTPERLDAFLSILDRLFQLRAAVEGIADGPWNTGWIAEEVVEAGFSELVAFDADGAPLSINYAQAVIPLHAEANRRKAETEQLRSEVAALRSLIEGNTPA